MIRNVILYTICLKGLRLVFFSCHQSWVAYILDICEIAIYNIYYRCCMIQVIQGRSPSQIVMDVCTFFMNNLQARQKGTLKTQL